MLANGLLIAHPAQAAEYLAFGECYPISAALEKAVARSALHRNVALFVEESKHCGPQVPSAVIPEDLSGVAVVRHVLQEIARARNEPAYVLHSRGDAWVVTPATGARVLDTPISFGAEHSTIGQVLADLPSLLSGSERGEYLGPPDGRANRVEVDHVPLLESLRALYRPYENDRQVVTGWAVLAEGGFLPLVDRDAQDSVGAADVWIGSLPDGPLPEAVLALGELRTDTSGRRYIASTADGAPLPPRPGADENPPQDPRAPRIEDHQIRVIAGE